MFLRNIYYFQKGREPLLKKFKTKLFKRTFTSISIMKATVVQFRRGRHSIHERHFLLDVGAKNREEAQKFVGKEAVWTSSGKDKKKIIGKISSPHGNKGLVRAIFERGLPGQAITEEVSILESKSENNKSNQSGNKEVK